MNIGTFAASYDSGASGREVVQVQVLFRAHLSSTAVLTYDCSLSLQALALNPPIWQLFRNRPSAAFCSS